jgi:hypothetical protein
VGSWQVFFYNRLIYSCVQNPVEKIGAFLLADNFWGTADPHLFGQVVDAGLKSTQLVYELQAIRLPTGEDSSVGDLTDLLDGQFPPFRDGLDELLMDIGDDSLKETAFFY